jgi:hypothetical protein
MSARTKVTFDRVLFGVEGDLHLDKYSLKAHLVVRTLTIHVGVLTPKLGAEVGSFFTIAGDGLYAEG